MLVVLRCVRAAFLLSRWLLNRPRIGSYLAYDYNQRVLNVFHLRGCLRQVLFNSSFSV
jgi:hypothetical protein